MKSYTKKDGAVLAVCKTCGRRRLCVPSGRDGEDRCGECESNYARSQKNILARQTRRMRRGYKYYA